MSMIKNMIHLDYYYRKNNDKTVFLFSPPICKNWNINAEVVDVQSCLLQRKTDKDNQTRKLQIC
jgi:hypothetical protein